MNAVDASCVLVARRNGGWFYRLLPTGGGELWQPLGVAATASAGEAFERARSLFPGRLVALCSGG